MVVGYITYIVDWSMNPICNYGITWQRVGCRYQALGGYIRRTADRESQDSVAPPTK